MIKNPPGTLAYIDTEFTHLNPDLSEVWEVAAIREYEGDDGKGFGPEEYCWHLPVTLEHADPVSLRIGGFYERHQSAPVGLFRRPHEVVVVADPEVDKPDDPDVPVTMSTHEWARRFSMLTDGAHLVGAVPSADEERLRRLLRRWNGVPGWHYHLVDIEALAVGWLAARSAVPSMLSVKTDSLAPEDVAELRRRFTEASERGPGAVTVVNADLGAEVIWTSPPAMRPPWDSKALSMAVGVDPARFTAHEALEDARWARAIYRAVFHGEYRLSVSDQSLGAGRMGYAGPAPEPVTEDYC